MGTSVFAIGEFVVWLMGILNSIVQFEGGRLLISEGGGGGGPNFDRCFDK